MPYAGWHFALCILNAECAAENALVVIADAVIRHDLDGTDQRGNEMKTATVGLKNLLVLAASLAMGVSGAAMAQSGGNGNGGSGGGNAHGAATAGPTAGGDNTSMPGSTRPGPHFKHKKKAKPAPASTQ
jgi:hypothetical protein